MYAYLVRVQAGAEEPGRAGLWHVLVSDGGGVQALCGLKGYGCVGVSVMDRCCSPTSTRTTQTMLLHGQSSTRYRTDDSTKQQRKHTKNPTKLLGDDILHRRPHSPTAPGLLLAPGGPAPSARAPGNYLVAFAKAGHL